MGFFNPNPWPIVVNISAVNVNLAIQPKQYVCLRDGRKVNDPLLEAYVGPDLLAKETKKEGVPQVLFPRPEAMQIGSGNGVAANTTVSKDSRGIVQDSSFQGVGESVQPGTSGSSIQVYSVREAVKKGIIRPMITPKEDTAPKETDGQPMRGDNMPSIDSLTPREAKPSEARKMFSDEKPAEPKLEPVQESQPETSAPISQEEIQRRTADLMKAITPAEPVFTCRADGKTFKKKGYLLKHVQKHYPDREKELMEGY